MYGDVEKLLVGWGTARFPAARSCTELPATLPGLIIQFGRYGGGVRPVVGFDFAPVDVDCYGPDRAAAHNLAEEVAEGLLYSLPGYSFGGLLVLSAETTSAPFWAPYDNTNVRRASAAYLIRTRNTL